MNVSYAANKTFCVLDFMEKNQSTINGLSLIKDFVANHNTNDHWRRSVIDEPDLDEKNRIYELAQDYAEKNYTPEKLSEKFGSLLWQEFQPYIHNHLIYAFMVGYNQGKSQSNDHYE